eukprot:8264181-Pyramimonas_sp.AAC.1
MVQCLGSGIAGMQMRLHTQVAGASMHTRLASNRKIVSGRAYGTPRLVRCHATNFEVEQARALRSKSSGAHDLRIRPIPCFQQSLNYTCGDPTASRYSRNHGVTLKGLSRSQPAATRGITCRSRAIVEPTSFAGARKAHCVAVPTQGKDSRTDPGSAMRARVLQQLT